MESNHPTGRLIRPAGFEDPRASAVGCVGVRRSALQAAFWGLGRCPSAPAFGALRCPGRCPVELAYSASSSRQLVETVPQASLGSRTRDERLHQQP
ncbi:MAG: hypothetical protein QOJ29_3852 [Thermoleophilaceae bacterium]|nr:hypothetical protein [Thermoleophilaceae bacterium]